MGKILPENLTTRMKFIIAFYCYFNRHKRKLRAIRRASKPTNGEKKVRAKGDESGGLKTDRRGWGGGHGTSCDVAGKKSTRISFRYFRCVHGIFFVMCVASLPSLA